MMDADFCHKRYCPDAIGSFIDTVLCWDCDWFRKAIDSRTDFMDDNRFERQGRNTTTVFNRNSGEFR